MINENVAFAKSILNKNGISPDSPEYQDYLKIREICGNSNGYVGILTKIRFVENIIDMDEIKSIYDVLKNSKIDVNKLNKLSYSEILDIFYDEFTFIKKDTSDIELIYKDVQYSYYRVYTYKGILKIGSPSWCLKTKSNWDKYQESYPYQWVIIDNRYVKNIISPDNDYLTTYSSKYGWIRFGISVSKNIDGTIKFIGNSDTNASLKFNPKSYTYYGVACTVFNLMAGINKSYYQHFPGCSPYPNSKSWHKVVDRELFIDRLNIPKENFSSDDELYISLSESYSNTPTILLLSRNFIRGFFPTDDDKVELKYAILSGGIVKKILEDYALSSNGLIFTGIKLKLNKIKNEDIDKYPQFVKRSGKWIIFDHNNKYYLVVNSTPNDYNIPTYTLNKFNFEIDDPLFFYIDKNLKNGFNIKSNFDYIKDVCNDIFKDTNPVKDKEPNKNSKNKNTWIAGYRFLDFLKNKK